jgi:predicted permease
MRLLSESRERLRALFHRARGEGEMESELRFHIEMQTEENLRLGMEPAEARRQAALAFGGVERVKEEVREARSLGFLGRVAMDFAYAGRSFRSGRSGLLMSAVVLAMAIGAGTTVFSVVSGVLLNSLPYRAPERLVNVRVAGLKWRSAESGGATMSKQSVDLLLSPSGAFESAAYFSGAGEPVLIGMGEPEHVSAFGVGPDFFKVLGSRPLLGRTLVASDAVEGGGDPLVLSHRFWVSHFGGSVDVIGRTLRLGDRTHTIVGVMPPAFDFPEGAQVWEPAPATLPAASERVSVQGRYWLVARLAPGLTPKQAQDRLDSHFAVYGRENSEFADWGPNLISLRAELTRSARKPLLLLLGAVALVLLLACANVAAVLLTRGITRRRELAVRLSMGATRGRVARQLLIEAVLLSLVSGVGGVLIAMGAVPVLVSLMGEQLPGAARISIDGRVLAATLVASTLTGLVAGVLPALLVGSENVSAALRDGGAGSGTSSWRTRSAEGLVVVQVGLGTVLVTSAFLLVFSFVKLMHVDFGFRPAGVAVAQLSLPGERYASPEQRAAFIDEVLERASAIPDVESAAAGTGIPFSGGAIGTVEILGEPAPDRPTDARFTEVTSDYFRALGISLVKGEALPPAGPTPDGPILVNEAFVRAYLPGKDPIGHIVSYYGGGVRGEIVGVVADTRHRSLTEPAPPQLYSAFRDGGYLKVLIRTRGNPGAAIAALRRAIRSADPLLPIDRIGMLTELVDESVSGQRFIASVVSSFALLALLITTLGIYALTAYSVSRRSREIGIRMAMGATGRNIRRATLGRAMLLASGGVALGLVGALGAAKLLNAYMFGLSPSDPRVLLGVMLLLVLATLLAAYAPARRATRIDPMIVLRTD